MALMGNLRIVNVKRDDRGSLQIFECSERQSCVVMFIKRNKHYAVFNVCYQHVPEVGNNLQIWKKLLTILYASYYIRLTCFTGPSASVTESRHNVHKLCKQACTCNPACISYRHNRLALQILYKREIGAEILKLNRSVRTCHRNSERNRGEVM